MQPWERRLTICPHGLPRDAAVRDLCMALLLPAGADVDRFFDGAGQPIERFASYLSHVRALQDNGPPPLILLTQTNPIALAVIQTRRVLEEAVPKLAAAPWLIFVNELDDPFFIGAASGLGSFDRDLESAPTWRGPHGYRFLTLSAHVTNIELVVERVAELETESLIESGVRVTGTPCHDKSSAK